MQETTQARQLARKGRQPSLSDTILDAIRRRPGRVPKANGPGSVDRGLRYISW